MPRRVALGLLRVVPVLVLLVGIPTLVLNQLTAAGIRSNIGLLAVSLGGLLFTAFSTARYIVRPTRAFGPVGIARGGAAFAYLYYLIPSASLVIPAGAHSSLTIGYGSVIEALLVVPVLMVLTASLVTVQDHRGLAARLRADFPARR